jgi:hypothetical protein
MIYFFRSLFIITFLILIYVIYRSEIVFNGHNRDNFVIYFIILILLLLFFSSLIIFKLNKEFKAYVLIIIFSTAISLYAFEIYLFLSLKEYKKYELKEDLKKIYPDIVVGYSPFKWLENNKNQTFLPLSQKSLTRTIDCNESGYFSINMHDRYGFNNPDDEWSKSEIEYLLLGDSFTYGSCVNRPNDIGSQLRILSNNSVLNLGQPANGPLLEYATLREFFPLKAKKILLLFYEGNDLYGLNRELNNKILKNYINDPNFNQSLKLNQTITDGFVITGNKYKTYQYSFRGKVQRYLTLVLTRQIIKNAALEIFFKRKEKKAYEMAKGAKLPYDEFENILKLMKDFSTKNNSQLYFIYLPNFDRYKKNFINNELLEIKKIVYQLQLTFIDIDEEVFKKEKNPLKLFPFEKNNHYTAEGYKKIALKIYEKTR